MKKYSILILFLLAGFVSAQEKPKVYSTGRVAPKNLQALLEQSNKQHSHLLKALPKVTADKYDCRTLGQVPPIVDQGQCGSCWDFSGTSICTSALIMAGYGKADGTFMLSEQYTLDCGRNGGCNGDDNTTVTEWAKNTGLPLTPDYGPYQARSGRCKSGTKMYKISDWGFCDPNNSGVASTQSIKNAMVKYGPIGAAIAADNAFMNIQPGQVFSGNSRDINHDIVLVGWDDSKEAWILRNSWGKSWCDGGYCLIKYGANQVGTTAIWATATSIAPPPPPPGPGPGPGVPVITSAVTANAIVGTNFNYQITATNTPTSYSAVGLPAGFTCSPTGLISGVGTTPAVVQVALLAVNASGAGTSSLTFTISNVPGPNPGGVSINLTPDQVQSVLTQTGAIKVTSDMTVKQLIEAMDKAKLKQPTEPTPCHNCDKITNLEDEVKTMKQGIDAILKVLLPVPKEGAK